MTTLKQAFLVLRRAVRDYATTALACVPALGLVTGVFDRPASDFAIWQWLVAVLWLGLLGRAVWLRMHADRKPRLCVRLDFKIGLLLLTAAHVLVQSSGAEGATLYPLVYVVVGCGAAFAAKPSGFLLVVAALVIESLLYLMPAARDPLGPVLTRLFFIASFGGLHVLITRAELVRVRLDSRRQLELERKQAEHEARQYRLVGVATEGADADADRLTRSSVEQVRQARYFTLDLLKHSLGLHTCILLELDGSEEPCTHLVVAEQVSDSDDLHEDRIPKDSGAVGSVVKRQLPVTLEHLSPRRSNISYYKGPSGVQSFLGIPVIDEGKLRGVLCADRLEDRPFDEEDRRVMQEAVLQILRSIENERLFIQLDQTKREQTVLHHASSALGAAQDEEAVIEAALVATKDIVLHDFSAVTFYDPETHQHRVRRAQRDGSAVFEDVQFKDNQSLTSMAIKTRHYLPHRGHFDARKQMVYTRDHNLTGMKSLLVLPLLVRNHPLGTMTIAARRGDAFGPSIRSTLRVLSNQLAVALSNAEAVQRLEQMATLDGLTGCLNKRAFQEELESRLRVASRVGHPLSLIVSDIDHFKCVNDTYGHSAGDVVLKRLGGILNSVKRETDVVARFGGEEFCILCEGTGVQGAMVLAELVREKLKACDFQTENGVLNVTTSLGIAQFPQDASDAASLFDLADRALYAAKESGRDRVCAAGAH